jgi:glycerophosphoryl diester phosphodiesterase
MIFGHRGAAALAPENTLAAIKEAAVAGVAGVEIDTQLTADGIPVIFHDETLDRCTNGSGKLAAHTLNELKKLDAGSWFSPSFANEPVPTLEEALQTCCENGLSLNLEIKVYHDCQVMPLVEEVARVIRQSEFPVDKLLLSSFSLLAVEACQALLPEVRRGYITEQESTQYLDEIKQLDLYSVHVNQKVLTSEMAQSITDSGYILNIWTMNAPDKVPFFKQMDVNVIITDNPTIF